MSLLFLWGVVFSVRHGPSFSTFKSNLIEASSSKKVGIACRLKRRTHDRKVASSNPGRSGGRIFSPELLCLLTLVRCPFHPRVTAVARKRPRSFCQKCRWTLHLNTHTPLAQRGRNGLTMPLSKHSAGPYPETISHATCRRTFGHSRFSSLNHCELILA